MNLRKQLTISGQIDGNNLPEQANEDGLRPSAQAIREVQLKEKEQKNNKTSLSISMLL
jgi:hypothetical protein